MSISPRPLSPTSAFAEKKCLELEAFNTQLHSTTTAARRVGGEALTLLVDYTSPQIRLSDEGKLITTAVEHKYVLKWTDQLEIASNRLYSALSQALSEDASQHSSSFFSVPKVTAFHGNQIGLRATTFSVGPETSLRLSSIFKSIHQHFIPQAKKLSSPTSTTETDKTTSPLCIAQFEKIEGQNLSDFFISHYSQLNLKEKESLFRRLGRLAFLDLALGQTDRLAQVRKEEEDEDQFAFSESANLENIMIQRFNEGFALFAIDNGIKPSLCNPDEASLYLTFLQETLSSPDFVLNFAQTVQKSLVSALEELEGTRPCLVDLRKSTYLDSVSQGIEKMQKTLQTEIIPKWNSSEQNEFKSRLDKTQPGFSAIISKQLEQIRSTKKSPPKELQSLDHTKLDEETKRLTRIAQHAPTPTSPEFKKIICPHRDANPKLETLYGLVHEIQKQSNPDQGLLQQLQQITEALLTERGVSGTTPTRPPAHIAPTPFTPMSPGGSFRVEPSLSNGSFGVLPPSPLLFLPSPNKTK